MPLRSDYAGQACSMARALEAVGERWTLLVLRDMFYGVRRFTDLQRHLGIPRAVLAARLDALVTSGLVARAEPGRGRTEYTLTDRGLDVWPVLYALYRWGDADVPGAARRRTFRHAACPVDAEAELDRSGACRSCGRHPEPAELAIHPGPGLAAEPEPVEAVGRALLAPHRLLQPLP